MKTKSIFSIISALSLIVFTSCPSPLEPGKLALLQDLESPRIVITSPADYSEYATVIELEGYIEDTSLANLPADTELAVSYRIPGTSISGTIDVSLPEGAFSGLINVSDLSGDKVIEFTAADINGNTASMSINIVKPAGGGDISGFNVTPANKQVTISWDQVPGAESYEIFESSYGETITSDMITGTSYTWSGLENGEIYNFQLTAFLKEGIGEDAVSEYVTKMPLSDRSFAPWVKEVGYKSITLEWQKNKNVDRYIIERSQSPNGPWETRRVLADNEFTDEKVEVNNRYFYRIKPYIFKDINSDSICAYPGFFTTEKEIGNFLSDGYFESTAIEDTLAYIANGTYGLSIVDISVPGSTSLIGNYDTEGYSEDVIISDSLAYIADGDEGLVIVDISIPKNPQKVSTLDTNGYAYSLELFNSNLYLACGDELAVIDISNINSPQQIFSSTISAYDSITDVCRNGDWLYLADGTAGVRACNNITPSHPIPVSTRDTSGSAKGISIKDSFLYLADNDYISIFDISTPNFLSLISSTATTGECISIASAGAYAYLTDASDGLVIYNISDLPSLILENSYDLFNHARDIELSGNYAFISDYETGLYIYDISNPSLARAAGSLDTSGYAYGVSVSDKYAYIADWDEFVIIDISNPDLPTLKSTFDTEGSARGVSVSGSYAFIINQSYGLQILDIRVPTLPTIVGSVNLSEECYDVATAGNYAYIAGASGIDIIDISSINEPIKVGSFPTSSNVFDIVIEDSYAYLAENYNGLEIVNISDPLSPESLSQTSTTDRARGVSVSDGYAYLATNDSGLRIYDISDPESPVFLEEISTGDSALSVSVIDQTAYVASESNGLNIIDISNPSEPLIIANIDELPGNALDVFIAGSYAYVAQHSSGLQIINLLGE